MKLHTLDQIDPLILKLERAVKKDDLVSPEQRHSDTTPLPVPVPAASSLKEGDWIVWGHKEGAPADAQIGHLYEFKFSQNGEPVDRGPCSQVNEWSSVYAYRLVNP